MSNIASITIIISNTKKYNMKYRRSLIKLTVVLGPPASAQTFHPASGARGVRDRWPMRQRKERYLQGGGGHISAPVTVYTSCRSTLFVGQKIQWREQRGRRGSKNYDELLRGFIVINYNHV
jgi:hypothetical protein